MGYTNLMTWSRFLFCQVETGWTARNVLNSLWALKDVTPKMWIGSGGCGWQSALAQDHRQSEALGWLAAVETSSFSLNFVVLCVCPVPIHWISCCISHQSKVSTGEPTDPIVSLIVLAIGVSRRIGSAKLQKTGLSCCSLLHQRHHLWVSMGFLVPKFIPKWIIIPIKTPKSTGFYWSILIFPIEIAILNTDKPKKSQHDTATSRCTGPLHDATVQSASGGAMLKHVKTTKLQRPWIFL